MEPSSEVLKRCVKEKNTVALPLAISLLKLWCPRKQEFPQESQVGRRRRLKPDASRRRNLSPRKGFYTVDNSSDNLSELTSGDNDGSVMDGITPCPRLLSKAQLLLGILTGTDEKCQKDFKLENL